MEDLNPALIGLIVANVLVSYKGFKDVNFFDAHSFEVDGVLRRGEHKRLISSGFLHVDGAHLIFNMMTLYFFSSSVIQEVGWLAYLLIYFAALLGGNLLSLYFHRNHGDYSAVGASGAVNGIVFAAMSLVPGMRVGLIVYFPAAFFAFAYLVYTIYGIRSQRDNIGHEAHLGGAILGVLIALALKIEVLSTNTWTILACLLPIMSFLFLIRLRPEILIFGSSARKKKNEHYSLDHEFRAKEVATQKEIDFILEKIKRRGIDKLTKKEREALDEYSSRQK